MGAFTFSRGQGVPRRTGHLSALYLLHRVKIIQRRFVLTAITFQLQIIGEVAHFDKTYVTIFQRGYSPPDFRR